MISLKVSNEEKFRLLTGSSITIDHTIITILIMIMYDGRIRINEWSPDLIGQSHASSS